MPEHEITLHARYITTDFENTDAPKHPPKPDKDAQEGAFRAYRRLLPDLKSFSTSNQCPDWRMAARHLRPALERVSTNYWMDLDFDDRKRAPQVKEEVRKLLKPLSAAIKALENQPPFVEQALDARAAQAFCSGDGQPQLLHSALAANKTLLDACQTFTEQRHRKKGGAVRFQNAARDLRRLWEDIYGREFPRNAKTVRAPDLDRKAGVKRRFENPAAEFVFVALCEIGSPLGSGSSWVKASQVEEALGAVLFKGENSGRSRE